MFYTVFEKIIIAEKKIAWKILIFSLVMRGHTWVRQKNYYNNKDLLIFSKNIVNLV